MIELESEEALAADVSKVKIEEEEIYIQLSI
jgi:hypothetical protein